MKLVHRRFHRGSRALLGALVLSSGLSSALAEDAPAPKPQPKTAAPTLAGTAPLAKQAPAGNKSTKPKSAENPEKATKPSAKPGAKPGAPHPPMGGGASPHGAPGGHDFVNQRPPQNRSMPDASLPAGTVVVQVVNEKNSPIAGATVKLLTAFQSVAEGNSEDVQSAQTNDKGEATFGDLDTAIRFSYAASVTDRGATYDIAQFRLTKTGHRILVHTYPVTSDPKAAFVGLQGYVSVQVKEDLIRTDTLYRVINMSRTTWKPSPLFIKLPDDAQGVDAKLSSGDAGFEEAPGGVQLVGTFPPGQKDIPFTFFVPNKNEEKRQIAVTAPPHVVDMNVLTEEAPGMGLAVSPGFQKSQSRPGRDGKKVLVTRRLMRAGDGQLGSITIELSGLPVIGPGRWVAVALAVVIAILGALGLFLRRKESDDELKAQKKKARATLLDEMLLLEKAHKDGEVGPRTYEQTRREILAALARLEPAV